VGDLVLKTSERPLEVMYFTVTFPKDSRVLCRLHARFASVSNHGCCAIIDQARRILVEASMGRGGDAIVDFRVYGDGSSSGHRGRVTWWAASGILALVG
jgi:hypothetical protein